MPNLPITSDRGTGRPAQGHRRSPRLLVLIGLVALMLFSAAGAVLAYWTAVGTGTVTASAGTLQPVTVVPLVGGSPESTLVPGGPAADVVVKIDNQNPFDVILVAVGPHGTITASNGCGPTGVSLAAPTNLPMTVPPGISVSHLAGAATMDRTSASACQGASFSIPVTITVHR